MSGATIGILGYTKSICHGTASPLGTSMFTVRGNGLTARVCQPATVNNYDLEKDNGEQLTTTRIRPLSHGIALPQISWQHSSHRNTQPVPVTHSRNNSAILVSPSHDSMIDVGHNPPSSFPNFRIVEQVIKRSAYSSRLKEDRNDNKQQHMDSITSVVDYTHFFKVDDTKLDFKPRSDCIALSTGDDHNHSTLLNQPNRPSQRKLKSKFKQNNGKRSRSKTRRGHKKGKLKTLFSNHQQNEINSYSMPSTQHTVLQVEAVMKQKTSEEASGDCHGQISSTKSFRLSSSQTSLCSEVFHRTATIFSNLKKEGDERMRKVYLSEKQSGVIKDCGIMFPCAPPCSPTVEQLTKVEYVLSMNDIRSQRAVKDRLSQIENKVKRKELARKEEAKRTEKQYLKDQGLMKKQRQRLEIYTLNKIMTEFEEKKFQQFCRIMNSDLNEVFHK